MAQTKQTKSDFIGPVNTDPFKGMTKDEIKWYQRQMSDVNLYDGKIDGIAGPMTRRGDVTFKHLMSKGYTKSQMFRHSIGAPHMSDEDFDDYINRRGKFNDGRPMLKEEKMFMENRDRKAKTDDAIMNYIKKQK